MKQFFVWSKFVGLLVATLGIALSVYVWAFIANVPIPIDLIGPILWKYPVLDWLITGVGVTFSVLGFVYTVSERRTWTNLLYGMPMLVMNTLMVFTWWQMELGLGTDIILASILLSVFMLANVFAAVIYLFRRFQLPAIEA